MNRNTFFLMGGDSFLAASAYLCGFFLQPYTTSFTGNEIYSKEIAKLVVFVLVLLAATYFSELYNLGKIFQTKEIVFRLLASLLLAFMVLSWFYYVFPQWTGGRRILVMALLLFGLAQLYWHKFYYSFLQLPGIAKRVLIFGVGPMAQEIRKILEEKAPDCIFSGYIEPVGDVVSVPEKEILGSEKSLIALAKKEKAAKIIVSLSERRGILPVRELLRCKFAGIDVVENTTFFEEVTGKLMLERTNPSWFLFSNSFKVTPFTLFTRFNKRIFDIVFATLGLLVVLPVLPVLALAIKIDTRGKVLFRQVRVGVDEKPFLLNKFRTMGEDAETATGAVWALEDDPRITRVGRFLRKMRLDEIPQLLNVLKGDMSFVGPRPERPEFVEKLNETYSYYSKRHSVKPGITGWAQVRYPYGASMEDSLEKLKYDLYYIKNYSLKLDFFIILETVKVVSFGKGGR